MVPTTAPSRSLTLAVLLAAKLRCVTSTARTDAIPHHRSTISDFSQMQSDDTAHHSFKLDEPEAGLAHFRRQFFGAGELAHGFGQVGVRFGRSRYPSADSRQHVSGIETVTCGD